MADTQFPPGLAAVGTQVLSFLVPPDVLECGLSVRAAGRSGGLKKGRREFGCAFMDVADAAEFPARMYAGRVSIQVYAQFRNPLADIEAIRTLTARSSALFFFARQRHNIPQLGVWRLNYKCTLSARVRNIEE